MPFCSRVKDGSVKVPKRTQEGLQEAPAWQYLVLKAGHTEIEQVQQAVELQH